MRNKICAIYVCVRMSIREEREREREREMPEKSTKVTLGCEFFYPQFK